ncbi:SDR family oxidoreductase [Micromonosporaceae bacterium Da 78-11]
MTVLVTGASGTLGSAVLPRLAEEGYDVRPTSRRPRPGWVAADLRTGVGLPDAVRGVGAIVHLASSPGKTRQTDVEGTRRLLDAARTAGVRRVLYLSINGVDRVPLGYYRLKRATEEVVRASGVPFTILRAAQFPTLIDSMLGASSRFGPLLMDPGFVMQPVHIDDVADRIAGLLAEAATGQTSEFAGPQALSFDDLGRKWLAAQQPGRLGRRIWRFRIPGRLAGAVRCGAVRCGAVRCGAVRAGALTTKALPTGSRTWQDYLTAKY